MALTEFGLITRYFAAPQFAVTPGCGVVLGIGDDAAILRPPPDQDLVVSIDTLVAGVHFPPCLLYTSPSPRDRTRSRMPSYA